MPRRRPEDGVIDWTKTTRQLHDWVRALTHPYPGAFTTVDGIRVFVWKARPWRPVPGGRPGPPSQPGFWRIEGGGMHLLAGTADGDLLLTRVQAEGGEEMDGARFGRERLPAEGVKAGGGL